MGMPDIRRLNAALRALGLGELKLTGGRPLDANTGLYRFDCPRCSSEPHRGSQSVSVSLDGESFACRIPGCRFVGTLAELEAKLQANQELGAKISS